MTVLSPISGKPAKLLLSIEKDKIITKYSQELNIDVSKYIGNAISDIQIYLCMETGYRFYYPLSVFGDELFYAKLQRENEYYPQWKYENEVALGYCKKEDHILDIGCGKGNFIKNLKQRGFINLCGIDTSINMISLDKLEGISISNQSIQEFSVSNISNFDVITCFQVLEHIPNVKEFIEACLKCLKTSGKLIIAVPNNNPYLYKFDLMHTLNLPPHHAGLWDKESMCNLTKCFKLKLQNIQIEPLGDYVSKYSIVLADHLRSKNPIFKLLFSWNLTTKIFFKYLYWRRNKIEGRNIIAVFEKSN